MHKKRKETPNTKRLLSTIYVVEWPCRNSLSKGLYVINSLYFTNKTTRQILKMELSY